MVLYFPAEFFRRLLAGLGCVFVGFLGRAQLLSARMARHVVWTAFRDDVLRGAVRLYGRRWHLVAVAVGGRCSDRAARHRWGKIAHVGGGVPCAQESSKPGGGNV